MQCVAAIDLHNGQIAEARIGVGGASEVPLRAPAAEAALRGSEPSATRFEQAAIAAADTIDGLLTDHQANAEMRRGLVRAMVTRALEDALGEGPGR